MVGSASNFHSEVLAKGDEGTTIVKYDDKDRVKSFSFVGAEKVGAPSIDAEKTDTASVEDLEEGG